MLEYNQQEVSLRIGRARGYEAEKHNERKRGMMKKIVSALAALAVAGGMCMPAFAAEQVKVEGVPAGGYKFVDIAYDGDGTFVALAKTEREKVSGYYKQTGKLYYSDDYGKTWQETGNTPTGVRDNSYISGNYTSQQQLVWWDAKDMFVVHSAGKGGTYTSYYEDQDKDGKAELRWKQTTQDGNNYALHWTANTMFDVSGDWLMFGGGSNIEAPANAATDTERWTFGQNKHKMRDGDFYTLAVAAQSVNDDGKINMLVIGNSEMYSVAFDASTGKWETVSSNRGGNCPTSAYDAVYNKVSDEYLFVNGTNLYVASNTKNDGKYDQYVKNYSVGNANAKVTGVNVNDRYIVLGMSDGTMYYTDNTAINDNTVWKQVPSMQAENGEPVKNIEFIGDDEFVALSETGIYKGSLLADEPKPVTVKAEKITKETTDGSQGWTATISAPAEAVTGGTWKITNGDDKVAEVDANIDVTMESGFTIGLVLTETAVDGNTISSVAFELK